MSEATQCGAPGRPQVGAGRMLCRAAIGTRADLTSRGLVTRVTHLRAQAPLVPRLTGATGFEPYVRRDPLAARVALSTGAAGPVGGDHYELEVHVGSRSTLLLREVSATLALPGPHTEASSVHVRVRVEQGGTLIWMPQPIIAAARCRHEHHVHIDLATDARLFIREELVLGRLHEDPGSLRTHLEVRYEHRPLLVQDLHLGPDAPGYDSAAVLGRHKGVGTALIVEPEGHRMQRGMADSTTALMPLDSTALQISTLAVDALTLRRQLDNALARCGDPWGTPDAGRWSAVPR